MKKLILITVVMIFTAISSCSENDNEVPFSEPTLTQEEIDDLILIGEKEILTQQEIDDLMFLREEEKLARDVYLYSFDKYGVAIFGNISKSEQKHMDNVLILLKAYQLIDPASTERGVFTNQTLQNLYNVLIAQSAISLKDALAIGATIEDLDINDIEENIDRTIKVDILNVYDNLKCGSRNHLRNYMSQLVLNGGDYTPQYISLIEFTEIINSANERCGQ
jgi:hypothetical protein